MVGICESLDALLRDDNEDDVSLSDDEGEVLLPDDRQALHCENLIQSLDLLYSEQNKTVTKADPADNGGDDETGKPGGSANNFIHTSIDYNNKRTERVTNAKRAAMTGSPKFQDFTLREVFADSNASISRLPPLLASLMMKRVETEKLLPPTQDAEANEEAMKDTNTIMLTRPALIAAQLYSTLLTIPGALGSGLIEMEAVSSLAALFRRWRVECVTAVDLLVTEGSTGKRRKKTTKHAGGKRKSSNSTVTNPIKRSQRRVVFEDDAHTDDEPDESDEESVEEQHPMTGIFNVQEDGILPPSELLFLGLKAARSLSEVPMQREFMSWSSEAREALIDAITSVYGTVCALVTPASGSKLDERIVGLHVAVVNKATTCLKKCILSSCVSAVDEGLSSKRHETSVYLFRGLYPIMAMRENLPNGELGRQIACEKASKALEGFVKYVTEELLRDSRLLTPDGLQTSGRGKRSKARQDPKFVGETATATPRTISKKVRKKRVSFGVVVETNGKTPMLKSARKTPRPGSNTSGYGGTKPRPVLSAVLGFMQKLATTKGLDRARLRSSTIGCLQRQLHYLPTLEREHFLRFLNQLCLSKLSVHRLVGAELIGRVLSEPWLWQDHSNQSILSPDLQPHIQFSLQTPPYIKRMGKDSPETESLDDTATDAPENIPLALLAALTGRIEDRAPTVRARAAGSFADLIRKVSAASQCTPPLKENSSLISYGELRGALALKGYSIVNGLRKRAIIDEKATVRRTSVEALAELMLLGTYDDNLPVGVSEEEVTTLGRLCQDSSLLTRKAAAQSLTSLLIRCTELADDDDTATKTLDFVSRTWCFAVFPMTLDPESGCVQKAVDLVHQVVIQPITLDDDSDIFNLPAYRAAWRILSLVCESSWSGSAKNLTTALKASISKLTVPDSSYKDISKNLLRRICVVAVATIDGPVDELFESEVEALRSGVWCLFDALVCQTKELPALYKTLKKLRIDLNFLGTSWEKLLVLLETPNLSQTSEKFLRSCMKSGLQLLARMASCVHSDIAHESAMKLESMLHKFCLPPDLIGPAVAALAATSVICSGEDSLDKVRQDCTNRMISLYKTCESTIKSHAKSIVNSERVSEGNHEATVRAVHLTGEISVVGFAPDENDSHRNGKGNVDATRSNPLKGLNVPPSEDLLGLVMAFLPGQMLGSDQAAETVRAHAFTCVGKACMRVGQEKLAKQCVQIFTRTIDTDNCPGVQSNALIGLGDLCCRYTSLVDCHLNLMAKCLQSGVDTEHSIVLAGPRDKWAVVRKNALLLLSGLLCQGYIKLRGFLFFRFLLTVVDNDDTVAQIGESILIGPLLEKDPKLFFNNFMESVFVLNCCMHPIYLAASSLGDAGAGTSVDFDGISLTGPTGRAKKEAMYALMLQHLSDEEKIGITARLVKEVLGSAASSSGGSLHKVCTNPKTHVDIDREVDCDSAFNVLSDTFAILSSPLLRVGKASQSADEDQDIIEDPNLPNPSRRVIAAKGKLLSKISRKQLAETCFPILCNLKVILQSSCSPLLKDLMQYMVHIYRTYKVETKDFLANDPNLLQELEYDARHISKGAPRSAGQTTEQAMTDDADSPAV